jgi:hypothetical protein
MDTGMRSLRSAFKNGSCNDCPFAMINPFYYKIFTLAQYYTEKKIAV